MKERKELCRKINLSTKTKESSKEYCVLQVYNQSSNTLQSKNHKKYREWGSVYVCTFVFLNVSPAVGDNCSG